MKIQKLIVGVALAAMVVLPAQANKIVLKFGHVGKPGSLFDMSANEFARRANARLGDKAEVQVFGAPAPTPPPPPADA